MASSQEYEVDGIAIIGMAGRFPGAKTIDEFWQNLRDGVESITPFSDQELISAGIAPAVLKNPNYVKAGAVLEDVELFDASFFGFNPREAEMMDPQQRLFLESVWEALENAGYDPETYPGRIGAYAGTGWSSYLFNNLHSNPECIESVGGYQTLIGNDKDFLTTRLAYKLNLRGPCYTVQTACSTSLVAISLACRSLLNYETDIALAGGISVFLPQKAGYVYQEGGILSSDGHCRAFDAKAQGTVIGSGVGIVVLKRLENALVDGDCIHAVIRGTAINNDGALKVGYTAPSVEGQAEAITEALALADIHPETITYIEAHGTGTALGDPIEVAALTQAFRASTENKGFCAIGSVKTNIGHLDTAAGVAGLIKTVLALTHKQIPPSLHFEQPNPQIDFANSPFYVNHSLCDWQTNRTPRRAGVSSFGIGGTNAHVVLEEAPTAEVSKSSRPWQLLLLSAKTESALETATANLANYLQQHPELNLADVTYTLQVGRRPFKHRRMLVCQTLNDAATALASVNPQILTSTSEPEQPSVVFMFPGQGAQYVNMALELYQVEPLFRQQVDECAQLLQPHLGLDLRSILYPTEDQTAAAEQLQQTAITQPALFVIEYALAKLWMAWGVNPQALIGHSIGEYVAACLAGVFSLEDALMLVAQRGRLMQQLPEGAMLSVALSHSEVQPFLDSGLSVAASNAPNLCVVSGAFEPLAAFQNRLTEQGISCRRLHTSHAFHSQVMEPLLEPFTAAVEKVKLNPPQIPFVSNVTGTWVTADAATNPNYWSRHLRQTVRFTEGMATLLQQPHQHLLLEVGPGRTLSSLAKQQHSENQPVVLTSMRHPQEERSDAAFLLHTLGQLWLAGVQIDWSSFYAQQHRVRIPLPTYPFERQRYWIEPQAPAGNSGLTKLSKKPNVADWFYLPSWKRSRLINLKPKLVEPQLSWLVFADDGVGFQLAQRLKQAGQDVINVQVGERFTRLSEGMYTINPQQRNDYDTLLAELQALGKIPKAIAHLWNLRLNQKSDSELFEQCQHVSLYSLLFLTQALGHNLTEALQITVVTRNLHEVSGNEQLYPEQASVLGLCRVMPQEYPHITCRNIDVVLPESRASQDQLVDQLMAELTAESSDRVVAYRGKHRWIQTFEPLPLDETVDGTRLRERGVYLITGAMGDVSLMLAEYLAKTVRAKLVLIEHPDTPSRDEWGQRKLQAIQELSPVLFISADVANLEQMQAAIAQIDERFGELHGVIHAAETNEEASFRPIQQTGIRECESHFQPKVQGLFVLEQVLQGRSLDFCLLQSSLSSLVGGFAAHAAANLFMDAFAHQQNQTSAFPWVSINWEGWQFWEARQMAAMEGTTAEWALLPEEGVNAFQRLLGITDAAQIVVSTINLQARMAQQRQRQSAPSPEPQQGDAISHAPRPDLQNAENAPRNQIEQAIANIWQELLGIESIGIYDNFFELGGHSLLAVQTISRLREIFQVEIPLRSLLLETPTIAGLAEAIAANQPKQQDLEEMAQLLAEIENLSIDQVQAKLAEQSQASK